MARRRWGRIVRESIASDSLPYPYSAAGGEDASFELRTISRTPEDGVTPVAAVQNDAIGASRA
jgi:hypothetical protein